MAMVDFNIAQQEEALCSRKDGTPLTNFSFGPIRPLAQPRHPQTLSAVQVTVRHLGGEFSLLVDLRQSNLMEQILQALPTCRLLQPSWRRALDAYLIQACRQAQTTGPVGLYFREHGLCRLSSGQWVFVCGDQVLGLPEGTRCQVSLQAACARLAWDPHLDPVQATQQLYRRLSGADRILLPIWAFTLFSSLRSCVRRLDVTTLPSLAILGGQNLGKTTAAQRYMLLFDDARRPGHFQAQLDARSTAASTIDQVSQYRDQVVLVDDLAKSASSAQQRQRLDLIAEVLRCASNDTEQVRMTPRRKPEKRTCQAALAFTGEFYLDNPSDLTRLFVVELREPLSGGDAYDRTLAATVFRHWMVWLLPRLDEELELLGQSLVPLSSGQHPRLRKNRMVLLWALRTFYAFAQEVGALSDSCIQQAMVRAAQVLDFHLEHQLRRLGRLTSSAPQGNLCWYILQGYSHNTFPIVSRKKLRREEECLVEDGALCIRTQVLLDYLLQSCPSLHLTSKEMNRHLAREMGLDRPTKEARWARKKIHGRRYLALPLALLRHSAKKY